MGSASVRDIVQIVKGHAQGNENLMIEGAAGLEEATSRDISFFHNIKYADLLKTTKAAAVLIPEKTNGTDLTQDKTWIRVSNPQWAFAQVLSILYPDRQAHPQGIHPKAVIDPSAKIAADARVGALAVI